MKNIIKKIFKFISRILLIIYTKNYKLIIKNTFSEKIKKDGFSQFGQDIFVLKDIFKNKSSGVFVDIGANHPTHCNNTYLLELNGWTGIAIEPQEKLRNIWPNLRKTKCLNYVIGPEDKNIDFFEAENDEHGLSGVKGFNKIKNNYKKINVKQKRLEAVLNENNLKEVDYLSIDVEGYEMNVLESIDFSEVKIKLIGIENDLNFKNIPIIGKKLGSELGNNKIRVFLKNKGYEHIARIMCDDFFIKK